MKVIDLLNKIANDEDVPKTIRYKGQILYFDEKLQDYYDVNDMNALIGNYYSGKLNSEIEILEENKPIEKISCQTYGLYHSDVETEFVKQLNKQTAEFRNKLNEVIEELNKLKEEKE